MKKIILKAKDNYKLNLHIFETASKSTKGYIQVIHGMEEHQERYKNFAEILNKAGYTVITSDMRGHGVNAPELGFFSEENGYKYLLSDQKRITKYIKRKFETGKVIIFAHSMGTIIARNLMQSQSWNYKAVILSGYPCSPGMAALGFGILLTKSISMVKGARYYSKFVQNISTGSFNKSMEEQETGLEWLSTNKDNIKKLILIDTAGIKPKTTLKKLIRKYTYKFLKKLTNLLPKKKRKKVKNYLLKKYSSQDYYDLPDNVKKTFQNIVNEDLTKYLKEINTETLIIWGERDTSTPLKDAYKMNKEIKDSGLIVFKGASHYAYLDYPYLTLNIIEAFLK